MRPKNGFSPPLAGRAVPVARDPAGAVVALQPGVEMLGERLTRDPEFAALGADLHPRAELGGALALLNPRF
jgi:hypothetical protein